MSAHVSSSVGRPRDVGYDGHEHERLVVAEFDVAQTWGVAVTWGEFQQSRPDLAQVGRALLYQFGVGLAFLATVGRDGGPRVHPMCPLIHQGGLYGFIVPGPKQADLHRDGRYILRTRHPTTPPDSDHHADRRI